MINYENDILKEWLKFRQETILCNLNIEDKKHHIYFEEISEKILKTIPKKNKKYIQKQLDKLDENFLDYHSYWNEKHYKYGLIDGLQLVMKCFKE